MVEKGNHARTLTNGFMERKILCGKARTAIESQRISYAEDLSLRKCVDDLELAKNAILQAVEA